MTSDLSVSLQGIARAVAEMDRAARRIAASAPGGAATDSYEPGRGIVQAVDYAAEIATICLERTAARANLKVLELQTELADETLRLLGPD